MSPGRNLAQVPVNQWQLQTEPKIPSPSDDDGGGEDNDSGDGEADAGDDGGDDGDDGAGDDGDGDNVLEILMRTANRYYITH